MTSQLTSGVYKQNDGCQALCYTGSHYHRVYYLSNELKHNALVLSIYYSLFTYFCEERLKRMRKLYQFVILSD